ncbi:hypothetical protein S245_005320, partial [Arachis hypogaea]
FLLAAPPSVSWVVVAARSSSSVVVAACALPCVSACWKTTEGYLIFLAYFFRF